MSILSSRSFSTYSRPNLQAYFLIALGILLLLIALILHPNPFALPIGLFIFGAGLLIAAFINPKRLVIAGLLITLIGAAIFTAFKHVGIPYDNSIVVIGVGLALLGIALAARRGYVSASAFTPGVLVLLVGLLLYPPTGRVLDRVGAPFILSLWFPGIAFVLLGVIYWIINNRRRAM